MPSRRDSNEEMYAITSNVAGDQWRVNIYRRTVCHCRTFSAARYGSMDAALVAAKAWRDEKVKALSPFTLREASERPRSDNTSGVPGVSLMRVRRKRADGHWAEEVCWIARVLHEGRKLARRFSCARYGNEKAFELAVQARQKMLESVTGFKLLHTPPVFVPDEHAVLQVLDRPLPARPRGGRGIRPDPDERGKANGQS